MANKLAHGPAFRIDSTGELRACETSHHDVRPDNVIEDDSQIKNHPFGNPAAMLLAMFKVDPEQRRRQRFEETAKKYNHVCIKRRIDSTGNWSYHFEFGGYTYRGREWLRDGEISVTNYTLVRRALRKLPEFRCAKEEVLEAYFNWLRYEKALESTRRYEAPLQPDSGTVRIKPGVSKDREAWINGMVERGWKCS
jgi:hypothetical protein